MTNQKQPNTSEKAPEPFGYLKKNWMKREPWVLVDPDFEREWLSEKPVRYYVHQAKDTGLWSVIDRYLDIGCGEHKTREEAIREFYKKCGRPIPPGTKLPQLATLKKDLKWMKN